MCKESKYIIYIYIYVCICIHSHTYIIRLPGATRRVEMEDSTRLRLATMQTPLVAMGAHSYASLKTAIDVTAMLLGNQAAPCCLSVQISRGSRRRYHVCLVASLLFEGHMHVNGITAKKQPQPFQFLIRSQISNLLPKFRFGISAHSHLFLSSPGSIGL